MRSEEERFKTLSLPWTGFPASIAVSNERQCALGAQGPSFDIVMSPRLWHSGPVIGGAVPMISNVSLGLFF